MQQWTCGPYIIDSIFVSQLVYCAVRVVTSVMRSNHKVVVAYAEQPLHICKTMTVRTLRAVSAAQHGQLLWNMPVSELNYINDNTHTDTEGHVDALYNVALVLLKRFYTERSITVHCRDCYYITPANKAKLR